MSKFYDIFDFGHHNKDSLFDIHQNKNSAHVEKSYSGFSQNFLLFNTKFVCGCACIYILKHCITLRLIANGRDSEWSTFFIGSRTIATIYARHQVVWVQKLVFNSSLYCYTQFSDLMHTRYTHNRSKVDCVNGKNEKLFLRAGCGVFQLKKFHWMRRDRFFVSSLFVYRHCISLTEKKITKKEKESCTIEKNNFFSYDCKSLLLSS
jgi:hypothetical protein